ncbi:MAG TPA: sodium:proton antiporter NhaD [Bacteroidales bacterium]|nr:sodium:proton antiporter NhaD [Bacteroidales bacterium]
MIILITLIFIIGYVAIATEHFIQINKAATAILTGVFCWLAYIMFVPGKDEVLAQLMEHLGSVSGILFFLLGAMVLVELIDLHDGFLTITNRIKTTDKRKLLWIVSLVTFFLSATLDNMTTAIVMVSLLRKLIADKKDRIVFASLVIIAANAGGAWSPIGDVTTTMLWIGGQISAGGIVMKLFLPSLVCLIVPVLFFTFTMKGTVTTPEKKKNAQESTRLSQNLVFCFGIGSLLFVPIFKTITHLPPFMGILFGLGFMWIFTELLHRRKEQEKRDYFSVLNALKRVDTSSILFFLGILMAIAALEATGMLANLAIGLEKTVGSQSIIVMAIGLLSAIVDNVPLIAATQGMYPLAQYPIDNFIWEFLAYCAGTGGSILIIGSAAGVVTMGMEKIEFFWYARKIAFPALLGYLAGAGIYLLQHQILHGIY